MGSSSSSQASEEQNTLDKFPDMKEDMKADVTTLDMKSPPAGCPMHNKTDELKTTEALSGNIAKDEKESKQKFSISDCPVHAGKVKENQENELNPANLMPPANQQPSPGQPFLLPTERQKSSIPRGGTEDQWVYPSQQMFWNAMLRKGWRWEKENLNQKDMDHIIRIHNSNNEKAWEEILKWESFHADSCGDPKLLKFGGKATEFSPRAKIRSWLGYDLPFDRHDWIVDRCGKEVRYIIDYYDIGDKDGYKTGEFVHMDIRPAFDSFEAALDRARVAMLRWAAKLSNYSRKSDATHEGATASSSS